MSDVKIQIYKEDSIPEDYSIFLNDYYLPLISIKGVSLYIFLKNSFNKTIKEEELIKHLGFNKTDYFFAIQKLEVYLLLSTYENKQTNEKIYIIKAPLSPSHFFSSQLMCEVLKGEISDEEFELKKSSYNGKYDLTGFEETSSKIKPYFENLYKNEENKNINKQFSKTKLNKELKFLSFENISISSFSQEEIDLIEKESNIFSLEPKEIAPLIIKSIIIDEKGNKLNQDLFIKYVKNYRSNNRKSKKIINKSTAHVKLNDKDQLSEKINYYSSLTPYEFLKSTYKNKTSNLLSSDVDIIQYLYDNYEFDNTVINAILDFELKKYNNRLIKYYLESDIAPILRSGEKDIISVLDTLYNKNKISKVNLFNNEKEEVIDETKEVKLNEENDEIDFESLDLDELRKQVKKSGKNN